MSTKLTNRSDSRRKVSSVASSLAPYASSRAQSSAVQSPRINIPLAVTNNINPPVKHNRSLEFNPALYLRLREVAEFRTRYRDPERRSDSGVGPEGEFGARRSRFGDDGMVPLSSFSRLDWTRESQLLFAAKDSRSDVRSRRFFAVSNGPQNKSDALVFFQSYNP
jgi:hypothetical protein